MRTEKFHPKGLVKCSKPKPQRETTTLLPLLVDFHNETKNALAPSGYQELFPNRQAMSGAKKGKEWGEGGRQRRDNNGSVKEDDVCILR